MESSSLLKLLLFALGMAGLLFTEALVNGMAEQLFAETFAPTYGMDG